MVLHTFLLIAAQEPAVYMGYAIYSIITFIQARLF